MIKLINVTVKPRDHSMRGYSYAINAEYHRPFAFPEAIKKEEQKNFYVLPCGRINIATGDALFHPECLPVA